MKPGEWQIDQLPGIGLQDLARLQTCGIATTWDLLRLGSDPAQIQTLANRIQVPVRQVTKWLVLADLARIPDVGFQYCGLLLHAGIGSMTQLSQASAPKLHQQLLRLQVMTMQRRDLCPTASRVGQWIRAAATSQAFPATPKEASH